MLENPFSHLFAQPFEIAVDDQGYGMSPEDLSNAFTRFYRGTPRDADGKPMPDA